MGTPAVADPDVAPTAVGTRAYCRSNATPACIKRLVSLVTDQPRPTLSTYRKYMRMSGESESDFDKDRWSPIALMTYGGESAWACSCSTFPTHRTAAVAVTRWSWIDIASAPPAHNASTTACTSCSWTRRSSGTELK